MSAGKTYIFECNSDTYLDCVGKSVFGSNKPWPLEIRAGDRCLLHHYEIGALLGLWHATTNGSRNLVPRLWSGRFPFQVKVTLASPKIAEVPRPILTTHNIAPNLARLSGLLDPTIADEIEIAMTSDSKTREGQ